MKLAVFNGSPRGKDSNTKVLLTQFLNGFMSIDGNSYELSYLMHSKEKSQDIKYFREADHAIIAFPLYFDSMPANVKTFIEALASQQMQSHFLNRLIKLSKNQVSKNIISRSCYET